MTAENSDNHVEMVCSQQDSTFQTKDTKNNQFAASSFNVTNARATRTAVSSSNSESSDDDSDDSDDGGWKRSRLSHKKDNKKPKPTPMVTSQTDKPGTFRDKKFNVWSNVLLEETLATNLHTVAVRHSNVNNDRECESYDYTVKYEMEEPEIHRRLGCKRSAKDRLGNLEVLGRNRRSFSVKEDDPEEKVVTGIATILREPKTDLIARVVKTIGKKMALDVLSMTEEIEESGGMMTMDESRRRTPGGAFLYLIRRHRDVSKADKDFIFGEEKKMSNAERTMKRRADRKNCRRVKEAAPIKVLEPLPTLPELLLKQKSGAIGCSADPDEIGREENVAVKPFLPLHNTTQCDTINLNMDCSDVLEEGEISDSDSN